MNFWENDPIVEQAPLAPQAQVPPTPQVPTPVEAPRSDLQQGNFWEADPLVGSQENLPVWERQNVVPREHPGNVDEEGRTVSGPSAGVPIGEAADVAPGQYNPFQGAASDSPEFLRRGAPEASVPTEGAGTEEVSDLPVPSDKMYDKMSYEDANKIYEAYSRHPATQKTANGSMTYKGYTVYSPDMTFGDLADPNIPIKDKVEKGGFITPFDPLFPDRVGGFQRAGHSVTDAVTNAAKTTLAAGDVVRDFAGGVNAGATGQPLPEPSGGVEAFEKTTKDAGIGDQNLQSTSGQIFDSAVESAVGAAAPSGIGSTLRGAGVLKEKGVPTLIRNIKDRALQGTGVAMTIDENSSPAVTGDNAWVKLLEGMNIDPTSSDAEQILAKKANLVIDAMAIGAVGETAATPLRYLGRLFKDSIARPIVKVGSEQMIKNDETREVIGILADIPQGADDKVYKDAGVKIQQILRGNKELNIKVNEPGVDDIQMARDPMSAMQRGAEEDMAARAGSLKGAAIRAGNTELEEKLKAPEKVLKTLTDQTQEALGGDRSMELTRKSVAESGRTQVAAGKEAVTQASDKIDDAERSVAELVKNDPALGQKIAKVSGSTDFDANRFKNETTDTIVQKLRDNYKTMAKRKDELFGAIRDDINIVDKPSFDAAYKEVEEYLSPQTKQAIKEANGKFGPLFNNVRNMIRKDFEGAAQKGDYNTSDAIRRLHDNIYHDQVEALVNNPGAVKSAQGRQALDAINYYREEYAPIWNQQPTAAIAQKYRQTIKRGMNENEFKQFGADTVTANISDSKRHYTDTIRTALGDDQELVTDYVLGDVAASVSAKVRSGAKLSDLKTEDLVGPLQKYSGTLPEGSPGRERIQKFLNDFDSHKGNIKTLEAELDNLTKKSKEIEDKVMNNELKDFFSKSTDLTGYTENTDAYTALTAMLRDKNRSGSFDQLLKRIDETGNPVVKKGMQVAYSRYLDEVFQGGEEFNKRAGKGVEGGWNNILEQGKKVFSDRPNLQIAMDRMVEEATNANKGSLAKTKLEPDSATEAGARWGIGKLITLIYGPLNRTGAKYRVLGDSMIRKADATGTRNGVFSSLMNDADYLDEAIEQFKGKREEAINKEVKRVARRLLTRAGIHGPGSNDRDLSENMQDAAEEEDKTSEQTKEVFGTR